MINRDDRIGKFLVPLLKNFVFDELSDSYLERSGVKSLLSGVPVPISKKEIDNISTLTIARGMAFVIGCDPLFRYRDNYAGYIRKTFGKDFARALIADGVEAASKKEYNYACVQFRAAIIIDPENIDAVYCYGRACKDAYEMGETEDFVARFKAESIEAFEEVTLRKPDFAESYYFLGYGYINLGLYVKAKLTWQDFIKFTVDEEKKREIEERLSLLDEPVEIEEGYNMILSGKFAEGLARLSKYREGSFAGWWPLWYYLGIAHAQLNMLTEAEAEFKRVLKLSPSNTDAMTELIKIYEQTGDEEKVHKYRNKVAIVRENAEKDRQEAEKAVKDEKATKSE